MPQMQDRWLAFTEQEITCSSIDIKGQNTVDQNWKGEEPPFINRETINNSVNKYSDTNCNSY